MKIQDIKHKSTLSAVKHYKLEDRLGEFETLKHLRHELVLQSRRKWQRNHRSYFKQKDQNEYKRKYETRKLFMELPNIIIEPEKVDLNKFS